MELECFYVQRLKEELSLKQRVNPSYSLRAFARDIDMHPSTLSLVLKGKRSLPLKKSFSVANSLRLPPKEKTLFLESLYKTRATIDQIEVTQSEEQRYMIDESYYKVIAEWEHYAVLTLFDLKGFHPSAEIISRRLGITLNRSEVVLSNLLTSGLIRRENGELVKTYERVRTTEDNSAEALVVAHQEELDLAKEKLTSVPVEMRDFSSLTVAMDMDKLPEAKAIIREFRQKMMALLKDGNKKSVYQLGIQLYPLTKDELE